MGFFSGVAQLAGGLLTDTGAGGDAARAQAAANRTAAQTLQTQFGETQQNLQPFLDAGLQGLEGQRATATPEGLDQLLGQLSQGDTFQNLIGERTRAVQNQLAAGGQTRSGAGLLEAARVPTEALFQLEQLLTGRQTGLAQQGLGATSTLGEFGQNQAAGVAGLQSGTGRAIGSGIITDAQAKAARNQQFIGAGTDFAGAGLSAFNAPTGGAASAFFAS